MEKEFIPYDQALELKEIGFDEPWFGYYICRNSALGVRLEITTNWIDLMQYDSSSCKAPLYQQAFRWFRDRYNIDGFVRIQPLNEKYGFVIYNREKDNFKEFSAEYTSVEDAELECLKEIIYFLYNKI